MSKIETITKPKLSVVLASQNACRSVSECLGEIEKQRNEDAIEIIVVDNSIDGTQDIIARNFPNIKLVRYLQSSGTHSAMPAPPKVSVS